VQLRAAAGTRVVDDEGDDEYLEHQKATEVGTAD
jgi:hypothetical protein